MLFLRHKGVVLICTGVLILLAYYLIKQNGHAQSRDRLSRLEGCLTEISSAIFSFGSLAPREDDLFYLYRNREKAELCRMDLKSGKHYTLPLRKNIQQLYGWSPDRRFLLLKAEDDKFQAFPGGLISRPEYLFLWDDAQKRTFQLTSGKQIFGKFHLWLDNSSFLFMRYSFDGVTYLTNWHVMHVAAASVGGLPIVSAFGRPFLNNLDTKLIQFGSSRLVFEETNQLQLLDLNSNDRKTITIFNPKEYQNINWLNFSKESHHFLFCAYKADDNFRNLFRLDSKTAQISRLTMEHTYNGQWLEEGHGFAYIGNVSNSFYLAVRPARQCDTTNLFMGGYVERYVVSLDGCRLFAVATTNAEPRGLWEYDTRTKLLRLLVPGNRRTFHESSLSTPQEFTVPSFDGLEIPVYLFSAHGARSSKKIPVVLYIPPRFSQCRRGYEIQPQLLSNLGFCYLGINYRGCDGYGRAYSGKWDAIKAAKDVRIVADAVLVDSTFDKERIFLVSVSDGSNVLNAFLRLYPHFPRAVVFEGPSSVEFDQGTASQSWPKTMISAGKDDPAYRSIRMFEMRATATSIPVKFDYRKNYGHFGDEPIERGAQEGNIARFLMDCL